MRRLFRPLLLTLFALWLTGCALVRPIEDPTVELAGLQMLPATGMEQRVRVKLRVVNPNNRDLALDGLNFSLRLASQDVLNGVSNRPFTLPALGEERVELDLSLNVLSSLNLLRELFMQPDRPLKYSLTTRLYLDDPLLPNIKVSRQGLINLSQPRLPAPGR